MTVSNVVFSYLCVFSDFFPQIVTALYPLTSFCGPLGWAAAHGSHAMPTHEGSYLYVSTSGCTVVVQKYTSQLKLQQAKHSSEGFSVGYLTQASPCSTCENMLTEKVIL